MTDDFLFKISCEVGVTSSEISVEEITEKLGVSPHRFLGKERNLVQGTPALKESGGITFGLYRLLRESSNTKM